MLMVLQKDMLELKWALASADRPGYAAAQPRPHPCEPGDIDIYQSGEVAMETFRVNCLAYERRMLIIKWIFLLFCFFILGP